MIQFDSDTLEARLLRLLLKELPLTMEEAARELSVSESKLKRTVKGLVSRGIVQVEGFPDKKYLRLLRRDISFHGTNPSQEKTIKHKKSSRKKKKEEGRCTDMMYQ